MESLAKNITVAAVLTAQVPDTTGEILIVKNADISSLPGAPINTEHKNPSDIDKADDPSFRGFNTVVGRVESAKKIFSDSDCDNQYELDAWNDLQVPLIFGYVTFFDGDDAHDNAKAASSLVRVAHKNGFDHMVNFSVEGQVLKRQKNILEETVIKTIAATTKPANKAAVIKGVIQDTSQNSSAIFKAESCDNNLLSKSCPSRYVNIVQDFGLSNALFKLRKAIEAGVPSVAPGSLSGGTALQASNHLGNLEKLTGKKPASRRLLKKLLPQATEEQLEQLYSHLKKLRLKKSEKECEELYWQLKK